MTVDYTAMHCNTLHYIVEYTANTAVQTTKQGLTISNLPPRTHCSKKVLQKTNINADIVKHTVWQTKYIRDAKPQQSK